MKDDLLYFGIENPLQTRRTILEASKDTIQILQRQEKLKAIRAEKSAQIAKFKIIYEEIISMISSIKEELPKIELSTLPKQEAQKTITQHHEKQKPKPSVERLEAELSEIEQKLKAME